MSNWVNSDGLNVRFHRDRALDAKVGVPRVAGMEKEVVVELNYSRMTTSGGLVGGYPNTFIPAGSYIKSVTLVVTTGFDSGTTATLDLGLCNKDGSYTGLDEDGFDVAIAETAIDTAGKEVACDGALIGTILSKGGYPSYDLDTAAYTVGDGYLVIVYETPPVQ